MISDEAFNERVGKLDRVVAWVENDQVITGNTKLSVENYGAFVRNKKTAGRIAENDIKFHT